MNVGDLRIFVSSQEEPGGIPRINGIRLNGILLSLLLVFSFSGTGGAAGLANAAAEKTDETAKTAEQAEDENQKKTQQVNDLKLRGHDSLFSEQAKSLAKGYRETAKMIMEQGDDPKPVLDAAAYFEKQSEAF
jgi:cell division protein FtsB